MYIGVCTHVCVADVLRTYCNDLVMLSSAGLKVPGMQSIAAVASCLVLKHMFNPNK